MLVGLLILTAPPPAAPSYLRDVVPLLTKLGCNSGACHGKGSGQNGFKLSLRGYDPAADYKSLTREFDARRIDAADPANSLLVRKAAGQVAHAGGRLTAPGGREFDTLVAWVRAGAPGPVRGEPEIAKLAIEPPAVTLAGSESTAFRAVATFADGTTADVTWLTKFDTNDAAVARLAGPVAARGPASGATAVRAAYLTEVATAVVTCPSPTSVAADKFPAQSNPLDAAVFANLKALGIEPSGLCSDETFVRRVHLDAVGRLPTADETAAFLADTAADKRATLIDRLLAAPEFTDAQTLALGDLFQNRKERDHDVRGVKGVRQFHAWLRAQVAANRPWDELARDVLRATGSTAESPAVGYYIVTVGEHRHGEASDAAESIAQAFLGTRIGCAKCHNHPLERYTQDDFYHFAAFFSRLKFDRAAGKGGGTVLRVSHPDENRNAAPVGVTQPRTGQFLPPRPLDRSGTPVAPTEDPRAALAAWVTGPANDAFAGAMVNRVWKQYLGTGLVEPVDDLRATNPPSVPAAWNYLVAEFRKSKFDLRQLHRLVLNSRTYQLDSKTAAGNAADARYYSHYIARRLPAEVLLDALADATGVPEHFEGYPVGVRAVQVPDPGANSPFLRLFGRSDRVTACACERTGDVTLPQLLHLQNSPRLAEKLDSPAGWLVPRLKTQKDDDKLLDELYLRTLARAPRPAERAAVKAMLAAGDPRADVFRDAAWAVLNSKEFAFNR